MMMAIRRLLAACALGGVLVIGFSGALAAAAPTDSASPSASASVASATPADNADTEMTVTPDVTPDNSRMLWILGGAGVVAIAAAAIVIARR